MGSGRAIYQSEKKSVFSQNLLPPHMLQLTTRYTILASITVILLNYHSQTGTLVKEALLVFLLGNENRSL